MVNIYKQELTNLQQEILRLLFVKTGQKLNQNQISKYLNVSPAAVMKSLSGLDEYIIKTQDSESKRWSIELNKTNEILQLKKIDNLRIIYSTGLVEYLEKEFAGATIILFGSYSRGEDIVNSDIDLAVIGRKDKQIKLSSYEESLQRKININFYESFNKINKHLKENLFNGIVLVGGIEL